MAEVLAHWETDGTARNVAWSHDIAPRDPRHAAIPGRVPGSVVSALRQRGITELYDHQARAFELATAGTHLVVATPTASGKSLCYNLPILHALASDPSARALYLFPTKALARDQEESLRCLLGDSGLAVGAVTYDGDTPNDARRAARQRAGVILSNPDMLHAGIMPHHTGWARLFANLKYVVIDELHTYRGVFGSHLANVVRRLLRIARFHGASPTFLFASATIGNPEE
ncbi:MAG: DEAD/DEAH box helicase, partial [Polyangiales bacterium]